MKREYHIKWHHTIDSTNNEAARLLPGLDNLSVIAARYQTAGRGQRGNRWQSEAGDNLTFSLVLKPGRDDIPAIRASEQFAVSEIAALSVVEYLRAEGIDAKIKWPNDIYVSDSKICGILIENSVMDNMLSTSIAGIGINLGQTRFPSDIPNPVSASLLTGRHYDPEKELPVFTGHLDSMLDILAEEDGMLSLRQRYLDRMYRRDSLHQYIDAASGKTFSGTIRGIADNGCLRIESEEGTVRDFAFKEISYII